MGFTLSEEQMLLADSVEKFVQKSYPFNERQKLSKTDIGFSEEHWQTFAELGWLGIPFSEEDGGFGGRAADAMIIMEQFGKGLVVEPYLASVVMAGSALKNGGSRRQKDTLLAALIDGSQHAALAFAEPQSRFNLADIATVATVDGDGFKLSGHKSVVLSAPSADFFVVSARTSGQQQDTDGVSLFIVPAGVEGLSRRDYATVDGIRASELHFQNVALNQGSLIGSLGDGYSILERTIDEGTLAVSAEAVGCMEALYKSTVNYCKTREQFGQPIGKFQALQHRMVDMFIEHEQCKSLMQVAAMRLDEGYDCEAKKAVSALKVQVGKSGRFIGQNAVHLHGGIGMTDELSIGHYFKRLTVIDALFGNVDFHLKRFGALSA